MNINEELIERMMGNWMSFITDAGTPKEMINPMAVAYLKGIAAVCNSLHFSSGTVFDLRQIALAADKVGKEIVGIVE